MHEALKQLLENHWNEEAESGSEEIRGLLGIIERRTEEAADSRPLGPGALLRRLPAQAEHLGV